LRRKDLLWDETPPIQSWDNEQGILTKLSA